MDESSVQRHEIHSNEHAVQNRVVRASVMIARASCAAAKSNRPLGRARRDPEEVAIEAPTLYRESTSLKSSFTIVHVAAVTAVAHGGADPDGFNT